MIRRPTNPTRNDTLFPSTTLFRTPADAEAIRIGDALPHRFVHRTMQVGHFEIAPVAEDRFLIRIASAGAASIVDGEHDVAIRRTEEHTSELQSLMRLSYAVFRLQQNKTTTTRIYQQTRMTYT